MSTRHKWRPQSTAAQMVSTQHMAQMVSTEHSGTNKVDTAQMMSTEHSDTNNVHMAQVVSTWHSSTNGVHTARGTNGVHTVRGKHNVHTTHGTNGIHTARGTDNVHTAHGTNVVHTIQRHRFCSQPYLLHPVNLLPIILHVLLLLPPIRSHQYTFTKHPRPPIYHQYIYHSLQPPHSTALPTTRSRLFPHIRTHLYQAKHILPPQKLTQQVPTKRRYLSTMLRGF